MPKAARTVLADALRLDTKARAQLASELLASLDGPPDHGAEQAWEAEIKRRVEDLESGTAVLESWSDVRHRIERTLLER
jgi:putative addiction module component (TIGR02574 family)